MMNIKNHVLVVGDKQLRDALKPCQSEKGTMVSLVCSLDEASCFIENRKVDLVVADSILPDGCGLSLLRLRDTNETFRLIALGNDQAQSEQAIAAGAIEFLEKNEETLARLPRTVANNVRDWGLALAASQTAQHQEHLIAIWDATPDFVGTTDVDGFFLHLNLHGRIMMGLHESEDVSCIRLFEIHDHESSANLIATGIPHAIEHGVWRTETSLRPIHGDPVPVSQVLIAHKDQDNNVTHFSSILHDLTEVKAAQSERERLAEDLYQAMKMESIGRLAGGVAHDLNNRLTAIIGYAELGLLETMADHNAENELQNIIESCEKASELIEQLVTFSRKQAVKPSFLNLNDVISGANKMVSSILNPGIVMHVDLDPGLWPIVIDKAQLQQIIVNLVTNSNDAMPGGGRIALKTYNRHVDKEEAHCLGIQLNGDFVVLRISDSAPGLDAESRKHLFEPFYSGSKHGRDGSLGLSSVYGAVTQNGGVIVVDASELGGVQFDVLLPREKSVSGGKGSA